MNYKFEYENLVFEGGGICGFGFIKVIDALNKYNIMDNIKRYAGTSAGSIIAALFAIGYTSDELYDIFINIDISDYVENGWRYFKDLYRLYSKFGYNKTDKIYKLIGNIIEDKTGDEDYTFNDLYFDKSIELTITASCLNKHNVEYFSHLNYPNMPIRQAIRMSISIPYYFEAVKFNDNIYVDGGMLNNYPINYFDTYYSDDTDMTKKTLGFKLMNQSELKNKLKNKQIVQEEPINNIIDHTKAIIKSLLLHIERIPIDDDYWEQTVIIDTGNLSSVDFDADKLTLDNLIV